VHGFSGDESGAGVSGHAKTQAGFLELDIQATIELSDMPALRLHLLESKAQSRDREGAVNKRQLHRTTLAVRFLLVRDIDAKLRN
jgi:hypothetical protein